MRIVSSREDPAAAARFHASLRAVLGGMGCEDVTSCHEDYALGDDIYLVVAEDTASGEAVGGIRVQVRSSEKVLPVERALETLSPAFADEIRRIAEAESLAELTGLWTRPTDQGRNLGAYVSALAKALCVQLGVDRVLTFTPEHTLRLPLALGFEPDRRWGDQGCFCYPDARFRSIVSWLTVAGAPAADRRGTLCSDGARLPGAT